MTKLIDKETALRKFEDAAIRHSEATENGDYKTGNKCYAIISKTISFLKERNEIPSLSQFLNHPSIGVRIWAATYLLPFMEEEGVAILEQIARGPGIHSLTAKTTLNEWRKGNLEF